MSKADPTIIQEGGGQVGTADGGGSSVQRGPEQKQGLALDPRQPERYARRVLVASLGLAPQVLTETLHALGTDETAPFHATEIHIVTTEQGAQRARLTLIDPETGAIARLACEHALPAPGAVQIHVIESDGVALDDIDTESHNAAAADLIVDLLQRLTDDPTAALHVSIAGGRKTMGFLMGYALSLYGRAQDRLSHVLVSKPFEGHPQFFFPPKPAQVLLDRDNTPVSTASAIITLAEIPFVRLREQLPKPMGAGKASFSRTVALAQDRLDPPELVLDTGHKLLIAQGQEVRLADSEFTFALWVVERMQRLSEDDGGVATFERDPREWLDIYTRVVGPENTREDLLDTYRKGLEEDFYARQKSRFNRQISDQLWPLDERYKLRQKGKRIWFDLPLDALHVVCTREDGND
ncbi:MAG: CRISPR-associated ring nuclease Csm6 [Neomegalonema sp.]|nr:CRISPR-associated ring nuclease Csm6 [Neomegalonema sp.]